MIDLSDDGLRRMAQQRNFEHSDAIFSMLRSIRDAAIEKAAQVVEGQIEGSKIYIIAAQVRRLKETPNG